MPFRTARKPSGTPTYTTYNAANELLEEVTPGGETAYYSYPPVGGRFARVSSRTARRLIGSPTYYSYNSRNLITRIDSTQEGFTPNTFAYNALGQRICKTDSTGTSYYV